MVMYQIGDHQFGQTMQFMIKSSRWQHRFLPQCSSWCIQSYQRCSVEFTTHSETTMKMALNVFFILV